MVILIYVTVELETLPTYHTKKTQVSSTGKLFVIAVKRSPPFPLASAVHTSAKFGSQTQDLNISLTAVGLLWNLSDYFFQNQDTLKG